MFKSCQMGHQRADSRHQLGVSSILKTAQITTVSQGIVLLMIDYPGEQTFLQISTLNDNTSLQYNLTSCRLIMLTVVWLVFQFFLCVYLYVVINRNSDSFCYAKSLLIQAQPCHYVAKHDFVLQHYVFKVYCNITETRGSLFQYASVILMSINKIENSFFLFHFIINFCNKQAKNNYYKTGLKTS